MSEDEPSWPVGVCIREWRARTMYGKLLYPGWVVGWAGALFMTTIILVLLYVSLILPERLWNYSSERLPAVYK